MGKFLCLAVIAAMLASALASASGEMAVDGVVRVAVPECSAAVDGVTPPTLRLSFVRSEVDSGKVPFVPFVPLRRNNVSGFDRAEVETISPHDMRVLATDLALAAHRGDLKAAVQLGEMMEQGDGVPADPRRASELYCGAARYGDADGLFNLGWAYAYGRGVRKDDAVAAVLFRKAAERGHPLAGSYNTDTAAHKTRSVKLPACLMPAALPVAAVPRAPASAELTAGTPMPAVPRDIAQLVQKLAPQYDVDTHLALVVIWAESSFNPAAQSGANAQGLMQLIPETAERFGVKKPLSMDDNIKGGLAYLRWLFAYFRGDVSLVLAAYNAGEGNVEKYRGIPPFTETRDYVKKIIGVYRRLAHPYNPGVVGPSPLIAQLVNATQGAWSGLPVNPLTR